MVFSDLKKRNPFLLVSHTTPGQLIYGVSKEVFFWLVKPIHQVTTETSSLVSESDTKRGDSVANISGLMGENVQITLLNKWIAKPSAFK